MKKQQWGPSGEVVDTPSHRALASASRVAILRLVRDAPDGLTAGQVAAATRLHLTTARAHLDRLADARLLVKERTASGGTPGRPAWRYRAAAPAPAPASYRGLAAALLDNLAEAGTDARAAAVRVGERWGRRLAAAPATGRDPAGSQPATHGPAGPSATGRDPAETVVAVLDGLGFAPRPEPRTAGDGLTVSLPACPFLDLVATNPDTTCALHLGVVRGVLEHTGGSAGDAVLEPFGAPAACLVHVRRHRDG